MPKVPCFKIVFPVNSSSEVPKLFPDKFRLLDSELSGFISSNNLLSVRSVCIFNINASITRDSQLEHILAGSPSFSQNYEKIIGIYKI